MVRIFAVGAAQVQREAGVIAKRAEELLRHTGVKIADALLRERSIEPVSYTHLYDRSAVQSLRARPVRCHSRKQHRRGAFHQGHAFGII